MLMNMYMKGTEVVLIRSEGEKYWRTDRTRFPENHGNGCGEDRVEAGTHRLTEGLVYFSKTMLDCI